MARLEPGDVSEDEAAAEIAAAVAGEGVHVDRAFTGRANLFAEEAGVLVVDQDAIDRLNRVDERSRFATLPAFKPVVAGEMIATVKIIPFAVAARRARRGARGSARSQAAHPRRALQDPQGRRRLDAAAGARAKVIDKTLASPSERLAPAGATIVAERRVPHDSAALAEALDEVLASRRRAGRSCSAPRRSPTGATSSRRRSRRSAARSSISACRSIRAT